MDVALCRVLGPQISPMHSVIIIMQLFILFLCLTSNEVNGCTTFTRVYIRANNIDYTGLL